MARRAHTLVIVYLTTQCHSEPRLVFRVTCRHLIRAQITGYGSNTFMLSSTGLEGHNQSICPETQRGMT